MKRVAACLVLAASLPLAASAQESPDAPDLQSTDVRGGVTLSYVERGRGPAVVLLHGELDDYRAWLPALDAFAANHRTVAVSRRLNHPNTGAKAGNDYSARVDGEDLAALIKKLGLGPVHLVGYSSGAYAALAFATKHGDLTRSLVLSEPPIASWLPEIEGGKPIFDEFMAKVWRPAGAGFRTGDEAGLRALFDGWGQFGDLVEGKPVSFEALPPAARAAAQANVAEARAWTQSRDAFPNLSFESVGRVVAPTLLLSGDSSLPFYKLVDRQLQRLLPISQRTSVYAATHRMWAEYPEVCTRIALEFLAKQQ